MDATETIRPELEALPYRLKKLPLHRGYPVPWFVAWQGGVPEFRAMDGRKFEQAVNGKLCWVCGEKLGAYMTFVAGPMCGINRTSAEPPCHYECAAWSARNCPFLSKPHMVRRENDMPPETSSAGIPIKRNPGVTLLFTTRRYTVFGDGKGGVLFNMGEPFGTLEWWAEGKPARREQVVASVESGLPILLEIARQQEGAEAELMARKAWLEARYPA